MRYISKFITGLSFVVVLFIGACSAPTAQSTPPQSQPTATTASMEPSLYDDPFAYCAAVGTVDVPDARYNGPEMPEFIVQDLIEQGLVTADAPPDIQKAAVWRCMDGKVWVCHFGANLPCQEKADTSQVPSAEMEDFCEANPASDFIPAAVTGRATVYEWKCSAGEPDVVQQVFQVDPQGYIADFWYELASE